MNLSFAYNPIINHLTIYNDGKEKCEKFKPSLQGFGEGDYIIKNRKKLVKENSKPKLNYYKLGAITLIRKIMQ